MRLVPLTNPVTLAPTCEPGLPDLSPLQTRSACPEVFIRNESHPPGLQAARGPPQSGNRNPFPFPLCQGLAVPRPPGSSARQVKCTDLSFLSWSLCSPRFIHLCTSAAASPPQASPSPCFSRYLTSVPTNQRCPHSDNDNGHAQQSPVY